MSFCHCTASVIFLNSPKNIFLNFGSVQVTYLILRAHLINIPYLLLEAIFFPLQSVQL